MKKFFYKRADLFELRSASFMPKELNIFVISAVILPNFISIVVSSSDVAASIVLPTILLVLMF